MQKARRHPKGAPTACRRMVSGSVSLRYSRFFSPFPHGTGSLSVFCEYLALPDGPGGFRQGFTCPALLRVPLSITSLARTGLSPPMVPLSSGFRFTLHGMSRPYNPNIAVTTLVWANPRSLATTYGITFVFFSCAYLDVSVQRVRPLSGDTSSMYRVAPFGNPRIEARVQLPEAYRSLSRPSSPAEA